MQRIASFLLTALILVNLFGFYSLFIIERADVKNEMAEKIAKFSLNEHQQVLTFSKEEFSGLVFKDNGNEFNFDGKLYDVVSIEHIGKHVHVTVEYDSKETALIDSFDFIWNQLQDKDQGSSPVKTIISHFQQDYVVSQPDKLSVHTDSFTGYATINQSNLPSFFVAGNLTPPPQFFLV